MSETYRIKIRRRGLPGSKRGRLTAPYTLEDLKEMFSAYMTDGTIAGLSPREVRLVETAADALERLAEAPAEIKRMRNELRGAIEDFKALEWKLKLFGDDVATDRRRLQSKLSEPNWQEARKWDD